MIAALIRSAVLGVLAAWMIAAPPAAAQTGALVDRMNRLERDLQALSRMVARGEPVPTAIADGSMAPMESGPVAARMSLRLQSLERDMQTLTGRVEDFTYRIDQFANQLDKLVKDVDYRLNALESGAPVAAAASETPQQGVTAGFAPPAEAAPAMAPGPQTLGSVPRDDLTAMQRAAEALRLRASVSPADGPSAPTPTSTPALPDGTAREQYDFAFDLLRRQDYVQAENALRAFVETHEGTGEALLGNAYYWLGETYYVRSDFVSAARTFLNGYEKHDDSAKAPDTLLKLGMAMANLGKPAEACAAFRKVLADHPEAQPTVLRRAEAERRRTSCP